MASYPRSKALGFSRRTSRRLVPDVARDIEKLMALIPPRKSHLVRWGAVLAPNSPFRAEITLRPEVKKGFQFRDEQGPGKFKNYSWSKMLAQVFKIDVTKCESCGGDMVGGLLPNQLGDQRALRGYGDRKLVALRRPLHLTGPLARRNVARMQSYREAILRSFENIGAPFCYGRSIKLRPDDAGVPTKRELWPDQWWDRTNFQRKNQRGIWQ